MEPSHLFKVKELDGFEVVDGKGRSYGRLTDILPTRGNDILVVKDGEKEVLVPAIKSVVLKIDLENRQIVVDLPAGLADED